MAENPSCPPMPCGGWNSGPKEIF